MTAGPSGAHPVPPPGWLRRSLLCSACWAPCAALLANRPLAEQKPHPSFGAGPTAACQLPDGFPGVGTMALEVRSHYFFCVSSSLQILLNLLHFTETELALTCYSVVLSAYRWGSHFGIGAYIWGGRKPTAATGASHVVHSLTGSADRDTFLHNHPSVLCQMPQEPALG